MNPIPIYPVSKKIRHPRLIPIRLVNVPRAKRTTNLQSLSERLCDVVSSLRGLARLSMKRSSQRRSEPSPRQLRAVGKIAILQTAGAASAQHDRAQLRRTVATDRTQIRR